MEVIGSNSYWRCIDMIFGMLKENDFLTISQNE